MLGEKKNSDARYTEASDQVVEKKTCEMRS